jgi:hypothetical protein
MRTIASAYAMAQHIGSRLQVVWFQDWALSAPFHALFEPSGLLSLREATMADKLLYDRARRKNLWLPALPQRMLFEKRLHEDEIWPLMVAKYDFAQWARQRRCYMSNYMDFYPYDSQLLPQLFVPVADVGRQVAAYRHELGPGRVIGIHIRRTDHVISTEKSPTSLFIDKIRQEVAAQPDTKVFLASDSEDVKAELKNVFGRRIVTPAAAARRDGIEGIKAGLADMYTLASTSKIYGSLGSTFSKMAARIGGIELWFLENGKETLYSENY